MRQFQETHHSRNYGDLQGVDIVSCDPRKVPLSNVHASQNPPTCTERLLTDHISTTSYSTSVLKAHSNRQPGGKLYPDILRL